VKLLWISNAPWMPSGYGSQSRQVGPRIARAGYEIEFVANDGTRGDRDWEGFLVRGSSGNDKYSRDSIREDLERSEADWLVFLYDAWVFTEGNNDPFAGLKRVAGWVPIDHYPVPQSLYGWLTSGHLPIAMSRYGFDRLTELSEAFIREGRPGFPVRYAPHAVDDVFVPTPSEFRSEIGVPDDAFLVGIVAANNGTMIYDRKGFGDMAHALALFMEQHPDAYVYVHTIGRTQDGIDLGRLFAFKGVPDDRLRWADQYALKKQTVTDERMAAIYSSFDVLLSTSRGEGFGLPVLEAQACGTPVIASNWTASAELVGDVWTEANGLTSVRCPNGWLVAVDPDYDPRHGADFGKPRIPQIISALREAHAVRQTEAWEPMRQAAIAKAEGYRADRVFEEHWRPILAEMEQALVQPNRAQRRAKRRAA
jgi:glycosyltransferase involved in cell wall biosynthesis